MAAVTEIVEPRLLLSPISAIEPAMESGIDAVGTKQLEIAARYYDVFNYVPPVVDEIRLVGDQVLVYSTTYKRTHWPGDPPVYYSGGPRYLISDAVRVTVPDRDLKVVYYFANVDQPQNDLYILRTFGTSTLLYSRSDGGRSGWLTSDIDEAAGSTVRLDFTAPPAAPQGLVSNPASDGSGKTDLYFDTTPTDSFPGQRFVRRYELKVSYTESGGAYSQVMAADSTRFHRQSASDTWAYGGTASLTLTPNVYSWSVRVQNLPVFPDGTTNGNALGTPWSEWSEASYFSVLPIGEEILVSEIVPDNEAGSAKISWGPVVEAASYEVWINRMSDGVNVLHQTGINALSLQTGRLDPDTYRVWVRALKTDGSKTDWSKFKDFVVRRSQNSGSSTIYTIRPNWFLFAPSNIQLNDTILSWDGPTNARYTVSISMKDGRFQPHKELLFPSVVVASTSVETTVKTFDLKSIFTTLYSNDPRATIVVSIKATVPSSNGLESSATSNSVEFTLPQKPLRANPIIETTIQEKPAAPTLSTGPADTIRIPKVSNSPSDTVAQYLYRNEDGAALDLEYVKRYQLRVTDLQNGVVRTFDETQLPDLMQLDDEAETSIFDVRNNSNSMSDLGFMGVTVSLPKQLRLTNGAYRFEARVQHLPVILSDSGLNLYQAFSSATYKFSLTNTPPDRINVAATPWSDWSVPTEKTILPAGENILPISKPSGTVEPRPTFAWGSNTANAEYELWVVNRATKQRVIHTKLTNVRQFQATTDLPPGQYDWWVRIVGTTGTRNGWSFKQTLEVYAPAISTSVVTETADATPVVSWTAVTGAQSYVVTLTSTVTGKVVYTANVVANTTSHRVATTLPNDTYTVSIQALLPNGARTAPGVADSGGGFVLKRMVVGVAPKNVVITSSKVSWQAVPDATKYDVWINYISPTGKTERIFRQEAFGTEIRLPANLTSRAGEYRVWIRAIRSEAGQDYVGRWSDVKTLTVGSSPASLNAGALALVMSDLATTGVHL